MRQYLLLLLGTCESALEYQQCHNWNDKRYWLLIYIKTITFYGIILRICPDLCGYLHDTELRLWKINSRRTKRREQRQESVYCSRIIQSKRRFQSNNSTKIIRKHTMLANFGAEIKKFRVSPVLISRYFTKINIRGNNFSLTFDLDLWIWPLTKLDPCKIDTNDKNILWLSYITQL